VYKESTSAGLTSIEIGCDARVGKGICRNRASVTMNDRDAAKHLLYMLGWRVSRGHQICGLCVKKKYHFPRAKDKK
jgi:hypothetical protein